MHVSQFVALGYPRRIIADFRANLERLAIALEPTLHHQLFGQPDRNFALTSLWRASTHPTARDQLLGAAAAEPLLRFRAERLATRLATLAGVRDALERTCEDVGWHVQRMYRVRNAIVHGGYIPDDLTHLTSHLATYLWAILRALIEELAMPEGITEIDEVFKKYSWLFQEQLRALREPGIVDIPYARLIQPTLIWPR